MPVAVVDLWSDGSGTSRGNPGGWAYVLVATHPVTGEEHRREGSGQALDTTNNRMELVAVLMGLRALRQTSLVVVHTDSQYVLRPFTEGYVAQWEARNWAKVKNADVWHLLIYEVRRHLVSWEWVRGHSGVEHNERADELAGQQRRAALEEIAASTAEVAHV